MEHEPDLAAERAPVNEQRYIDSLVDRLGRKMLQDYEGAKTLRDAHPKMHGCVRAKFAIEKNLPDDLAIGLFAEPRSYSAWIRFSNQSGTPAPDSKKDIRGAAIKVMGVEGEKLLEGNEQESTQDFVLISHDAFVTKDVAEFDALIEATVGGVLRLGGFFFNPFDLHLRAFRNLMASLQRHANPLEVRYFSATPYLLGSQAVKYSLRSHGEARSELPRNSTPDFLREEMGRRLRTESASFDFLVQHQVDRERTPIEDPGVAWDEALAPFRKVATVRIPSQQFDAPAQLEFGENLSFNPWHCLKQHRPLGGINRARRQVYQSLSRLRHERNGAPI